MAALVDLRGQKVLRSREELLKHLQEFELDLKFSVGIWYLTPMGSRFHEPYGPELSVEDRLELTAGLAKFGVGAIEAHYPTEANEENLHLYKQLEAEAGIKLIAVAPFIFYDRCYEFGSLSNPVATWRDQATACLVKCLRLTKEAEATHCVVWPGVDGYTIPFGHNFYQMWESFEAALAEAMDEVPGVRVAIEPKPYEPVPNNIYRTTADGLLLCRDIEARLTHPRNRKLLEEGHALVAMQPEIGHICMGFEDVPYAFARIMRQGRLAHTHWNSQPLGNYDQDLNVGAIGWESAEAALYLLKMFGYDRYFGIDINPERMPPEKAIEINTTVLRIMNERVNRLPHDRILACYYEPEEHRGDLELILAEARR